jgi:hypothetical protein
MPRVFKRDVVDLGFLQVLSGFSELFMGTPRAVPDTDGGRMWARRNALAWRRRAMSRAGRALAFQPTIVSMYPTLIDSNSKILN